MLKNINVINNNVLADLFKKYKTIKFKIEGHVIQEFLPKLNLHHDTKTFNNGWKNVLSFDIFQYKNHFAKMWVIDNSTSLFKQSITGQPFISLDPVLIRYNRQTFEYTLGFYPNGQSSKNVVSFVLFGPKKIPINFAIHIKFFLLDLKGNRQNVKCKFFKFF